MFWNVQPPLLIPPPPPHDRCHEEFNNLVTEPFNFFVGGKDVDKAAVLYRWFCVNMAVDIYSTRRVLLPAKDESGKLFFAFDLLLFLCFVTDMIEI